MANVNVFLLLNKRINILPEKYFKTVFLSGKVLHGRLLQLLLEDGDFLNIDILQGSVAT